MNLTKPNRPERRAGWGWMLLVFLAAVLTFSTIPVGSQTGQPAASISLAAPTPSNPTLIGANADDHLSGSGTPDTFSAFPRAHAVAVGDFNHDGFQDVVVGAPDADITPAAPAAPRPGAGAVYVIFGKSTFAANAIIDANPTAQSQPDIRILGANAADATGFAVATGDVNGDGNDDLIIGAPGFDSSTGTPPVQHQNAGAVYVLFGGMTQIARTIDLATANAANLLITGENANDQFGSALAVGDVNGAENTTADLLVGAPNSIGPTPAAPRVGGGAVFLFQGGTGLANTTANTRVIDLATNPTPATVRAYGRAGSQFGAAVAIGDINAQGAADMIVGAPQSARPDPGGDVSDTGAVFVLFGGANIAPQPPATSLTIDLAQPTLATLRLVIYGASAKDHLGASVAAGNIRGGVTDLVMGAPDADGPGDSRDAAGEVYVLAGGTNLNPADQTTERRIDVTLGTMSLTIYGAAANNHLGETVAVSRINTQGNTDSIADLLMGAPGFTQDQGAVYVLYGGQNLFFLATRDLSLFGQSDLTITGEAAGDELGWAIAAGDIDNNRGGDLVLGAPFANFTGRTDAGKVYVLLAAAENVPPVNQNPTVQVTKPNGGETALGGLPFNIDWTASDPDGDNTIDHFSIFLSTNSGTSFNVLVTNTVAGNLRTFAWNVPTGLNTSTARIRIVAFDTAGGTAQDDSNNNFTITDAGIGVTLTAPNGGEVLKPGDMFKIMWTVPEALANQVRGFDLFLATDGENFNIPITAVNPTQPALPGTAREFDWTVGNFCTRTARVLVRATSITGAVSTDASNGVFSIANAGPTVDLSNESAFFTAANILLFRTTTISGQEVRFVPGLTVEISTDEAGTTFAAPTSLRTKKNGRKLLIKGTTNGALISTFWPDNAIRIVRITNPNCGLTILRLKRVGNFIVAAPAFDGVGTQTIQ
jgi:FG-GAP repeat